LASLQRQHKGPHLPSSSSPSTLRTIISYLQSICSGKIDQNRLPVLRSL
jgi:hypothetical protein